MRRVVETVTLSIACLIPASVLAQECGALQSAGADNAAEYLRNAVGSSATAACVQSAFRLIAASPPEHAVPLLIQYLGLRRPLTSGERRGIFIHGNNRETLYPAVHELFTVGLPAEPALLDFIAHVDEQNSVERNNALYTLLLIHHGSAMRVIGDLMKASKLSADSQRLLVYTQVRPTPQLDGATSTQNRSVTPP
jgi:hypothetical protein